MGRFHTMISQACKPTVGRFGGQHRVKYMASAFGISFFCSIDDLQVLKVFDQGKRAVVAPTPHPAFANYVVQATSKLGVVWIKGISEPNEVDAYGFATRAVHWLIESKGIPQSGE